ncbi:GatB/YqeY domain-containing protein [Lysinibacillus xylanilyticus]|uniref:GatB/YqeY domain-containing protein n=1 Tax=Lysinibacillus xylanilyticus TaxID=582475 RepID=UPI00382C5201
MTLKQQVQNDLVQAMKDKNALAKGVLQIVKAGFNNAEKQAGKELDDTQLLPVIQKEIKQTNQALDGAQKANREDLIAQEEAKLTLLKSYLPKQLTEVEIELRLFANGITSGMNMGEAMKIAKQAINSGEAEARTVSTIVKELIK